MSYQCDGTVPVLFAVEIGYYSEWGMDAKEKTALIRIHLMRENINKHGLLYTVILTRAL